MKTGKLFYLLKQLNPEEFKGLKKAVYSPFFNTNERLHLLYDALRVSYPQFENTEKYRKKLFKKVFPGESFNPQKQHMLFTAFCKVIEEYLVFSNLRKEDLELKKQKIRLYAKRQMHPSFEKETKALARELKTAPYRDLEYYEAQLFLNKAIYFNPLKDKYDIKDSSLDDLVDALDYFFSLAKMRFGISVKNRERILAKPGVWRYTNAIAKESDFMENSVLFQLYQMAFSMLETEEGFVFEEFERLLFEHIDAFRYDARVLFYSGLNYVNRQVNKGMSSFSRKAFEWHRFAAEKNLLLENGKLSEVIFGNIVIYGCREKEFEWTKEFMENNSKYLEEAVQQDVMMYHLGLWNFYQREFNAVLSLYFNYQFSSAYAPKTRLITIRALFELFLLDSEYYETLQSNIKAYEKYIFRNNKYVQAKLSSHLNFIKILEKSSRMLMNRTPGEKVFKKMNRSIEQAKAIIGREWLIEKSQVILNKK